jgi:hypothetical protein
MDDYEPLLVETTAIRSITVYQALQAERLPKEVQFSLDGAKEELNCVGQAFRLQRLVDRDRSDCCCFH